MEDKDLRKSVLAICTDYKTLIVRRLLSYLGCLCFGRIVFGAMASLLFVSFLSIEASSQERPFQSISVRKRTPAPAKESTIDQLFQRVDLPVAFLRPILLEGIKIPELTPDSVRLLGQSYFVVVHNAPFANMAQLYRANRLRNKSNFVTTDCIIHPYFAFVNGATAKVIEDGITPDLTRLLKGMLVSSQDDYANADDTDVRMDISKNMAFLSVALKLLDPSFTVPEIQAVKNMVQDELQSIASGTRKSSTIFEREENYSAYEPVGFYNSSPSLKNFYRCREWLSRNCFPLQDTPDNPELQSRNSFRRSVLLFRSLDLAKCDESSGFDLWSKLQKAWYLFACAGARSNNQILLPDQYRTVFGTNSGNLKVTLSRLSEPFFRTKLLLSIRRHKPVEFGSTSIFDTDANSLSGESFSAFKLFPAATPPELDWLRARARGYREDTGDEHCRPLALLTLHAYGARQATNILADKSDRLDPGLVRFVPQLERFGRLADSSLPIYNDWRWAILSPYFKPFTEGTQGALRTEQYLTHELISAFAGFIDSHVGITGYTAVISSPAKQEHSLVASIAPAQHSNQTSAKYAATYLSSSASQATPHTVSPANPAQQNNQTSAKYAPVTISSLVSPAAPHTVSLVSIRSSASSSIPRFPIDADRSSTKQSLQPPTSNPINAQPSSQASPQVSSQASPQARSQANRTRKPTFHYLEPNVELFRRIKSHAIQFLNQLTELGYSSAASKEQCQEFVRLCQRLESIAEHEIKNQPLTNIDKELLGAIDSVLEKISPPTEGTLYLNGGENNQSGNPSGATFGLGRPGLICVIMQTDKGAVLSRGAVYTYYETSGGPFKPEYWARKLDYGLLRPPFWTSEFDVVQPTRKTTSK